MSGAHDKPGEELHERTTERLAGFFFVLSKLKVTPYLRRFLLAEARGVFGGEMFDAASVLLGLQDLGAEASLASLERVVERIGPMNSAQREMVERLRARFKGQ